MVKLMKYKFKKKAVLFFSSILFIFLTFEIIFLFLGYDFKHLSTEDALMMTFTKYFFLLLIIILYYHKYLYQKWLDFIKNFKRYFVIGFKDWLTGFCIMCLANYIILQFFGSLGQNEESVQQLIKVTPLIAFILTTICAPFIEEMIFRKSLQDCFHYKYAFMITSGILFGLVHVLGTQNYLEYILIIPYGSLGFMLAHALYKTDNIYTTIMMHMIHNGFATLLAIWVNSL